MSGQNPSEAFENEGEHPGLARDPDLEALPKPHRPGRRLTLCCLAITLVASLWMAITLKNQAAYALRDTKPQDLGELEKLEFAHAFDNQYVRGEASLANDGAVRYSRPLESDSYRLAQVAGQPKLWVEIRVPEGMEGPHFIPPTSFVGRLVPLEKSGLSHKNLGSAVAEMGQKVPADAWLLIDGATPTSARWALALSVLFVAFAGFNGFGLYRLGRSV